MSDQAGSKSRTLREAYEQTDFEMVRTTPELEVPTSTPAVFEVDGDLNRSAVAIASYLHHDQEFPMIGSCSSEKDGDIYVSASVIDPESGEKIQVKMNRDTARVYPKNDDLSFETFERYVSYLERRLHIDLEPEVPA